MRKAIITIADHAFGLAAAIVYHIIGVIVFSFIKLYFLLKTIKN